MRRFLFTFLCLFVLMSAKAQLKFTEPNADGVSILYVVYDAANNYVAVEDIMSAPGTTLNIPATVQHTNGGISTTYQVKKFGSGDQMNQFYYNGSGITTTVNFPEGMEEIGRSAFYPIRSIKHISFPTTLKRIEPYAFSYMSLFSPTTIDLSNTKIEVIPDNLFHGSFGITQVILPTTLKRIEQWSFYYTNALTELHIPASVKEISNELIYTNKTGLKTIYFEGAKPATRFDTYYSPFSPNAANSLFYTITTFYVPIDATAIYENETVNHWDDYKGKYREKVAIGSTGYTSYYLENENFKVPTGCTAYIITGITPSGSIMTPDQAVVKAFGAGKIIPKQTGFILQGAANSTIVYQANVTGTEESVTGNLLIGTATEQEFNASGYKYYIFSNNGDEGIGFYKQGTRNGASIKLAAHRAGLRLPEAIAPAKGFTINFESARKEAETTGIRDVRPTVQSRENVIYDLQGRRVTNPGRGIYIVNGKKVVRE